MDKHGACIATYSSKSRRRMSKQYLGMLGCFILTWVHKASAHPNTTCKTLLRCIAASLVVRMPLALEFVPGAASIVPKRTSYESTAPKGGEVDSRLSAKYDGGGVTI